MSYSTLAPFVSFFSSSFSFYFSLSLLLLLLHLNLYFYSCYSSLIRKLFTAFSLLTSTSGSIFVYRKRAQEGSRQEGRSFSKRYLFPLHSRSLAHSLTRLFIVCSAMAITMANCCASATQLCAVKIVHKEAV